MRKIDPSEYMVDGWDDTPPGYVTKYRRGSLHNKVGMTLLWVYYVVFAAMVIRGLIVFLNK